MAVELLGSTYPRVCTLPPTGPDHVDELVEHAREVFGWELDPHQRLILRYLTAGDAAGLPPSLVGLLIARQQGKSSTMLVYLSWCLSRGQRILSCAQGLEQAIALWRRAVLHQYHPDHNGPLADQVERISLTASATGVELKNGAAWFVRAANDKAARSLDAIDKTWYDEARHLHTWDAWNAIEPTMTTSPEPQSILTSNAGDMRSVVLNSFQKRGHRKARDPQSDDDLVWLEWSADPDLDYDDRQGWAQANPTVGRRTPWRNLENTFRTYLAAEDDKDGGINGWRTERLCQQVGATSAALDVHAYRRLHDRDVPPPQPGDKVWMAFTVDLNRRGAATMIGRQLDDGRSQIGVLSLWVAEPGQEVSDRDVANQVVTEYELWKPRGIVYNSFVAAGVAHLLTRRRLPLDDYKGRRYFSSCQMLTELIRTGMLTHDGSTELARQVSYAVREEMHNGDGWFFSRRKSPGPIYGVDGLSMLASATSKRRSSRGGVVTRAAS